MKIKITPGESKKKKTRIKILSTLMSKHEGLWPVEIANLTGITLETVASHLNESENAGLVVNAGRRYLITEKGANWLNSQYLSEEIKRADSGIDVYDGKMGFISGPKEIFTRYGRWDMTSTIDIHAQVPDEVAATSFIQNLEEKLAEVDLDSAPGSVARVSLLYRRRKWGAE